MSSALIHYPGKLKNSRFLFVENDNKLKLHTYFSLSVRLSEATRFVAEVRHISLVPLVASQKTKRFRLNFAEFSSVYGQSFSLKRYTQPIRHSFRISLSRNSSAALLAVNRRLSPLRCASGDIAGLVVAHEDLASVRYSN